MVKLKLSRFRRRPGFLMKKKDKNVGGANNMNNFNGGGDGEQKKEKDPAKVQDRIDITLAKKLKIAQYVSAVSKHFIEELTRRKEELKDYRDLCQARLEEQLKEDRDLYQELTRLEEELDDKRDRDGDDDNNGGGGRKNNKKGSDRDGDKYKSDHDSDGGGEMKGKNMDFMGKVGFGYKYGNHAGNEHEYQVGQLQCSQEVQSSEPKCLFYRAIMIC